MATTTYVISNNTTGADYSGCEDIQIRSNQATTNQGNAELIVSAWDASGSGNFCSSLIRFTGLSSLPTTGTITGVRLKLYQTGWTDFGSSGTQSSLNIAPSLRAWVATQATWNNFSTGNAFAAAGGHTDTADYDSTYNVDFGTVGSTAQNNSYVTYNLDAMIDVIEQIRAGTRTNNGFIISRFPRTTQTEEQKFRQAEGTDGQRPILEIDIETTSGQTLTASLFTNTQTFYSATVTATASLTPSLYTNTNTFYNATVSNLNTLTPALYSNTQTFYNASVSTSNTLTPALYTNTQTFYSATISTSSVLIPDLFTNEQTFYSASVANGVTIAPSLYNNNQVFYSASVDTSNSLTADLFTNNQAFYSATVANGTAIIPEFIVNQQVFYTVTVSSTATLAPELYSNANNFYNAIVSLGGATRQLLPDLFTNGNTFYAPSITRGAVSVLPNVYTNQNTFYSITLNAGYALLPSLITNSQTFYSASVSVGEARLISQLFTNSNNFYTHVIVGGDVNAIFSSRSGGKFTQEYKRRSSFSKRR